MLTPLHVMQLAILWLEYMQQLLGTGGRFGEPSHREKASLREARLILQVPENAPPQVIKAAYRALALKSHPDLGGSEQAMHRLNDAYARLRKASEYRA